MDRRERIEDLQTAILAAQQGHQADIQTAAPGIIQAYDPDLQTCEVQVAIQAQLTSFTNGTKSWVNLPKLVDCPVIFPSGGGCALTFPLKAGDECLVIFASRCIDAWWQNGGYSNQQAVLRMHDLSDGFVLPGPRSQPRKFSASTSTVQLRTVDGTAFVEINPTSHEVRVQTVGNVKIEATNITLKGNIILDGSITQTNTAGGATSATIIGPVNVINDVIAGGKSLEHHTHSGVQTGTGNTGQPV